MQISVITPATVEPILRADAKLYCKVTHTIEDSLFDSLIPTARVLVEEAAQASIAQQQYRVTFAYPAIDSVYGLRSTLTDPDNIAKGIKLPRNPIVAVNKVRLVNKDSSLSVTLTVDDYVIEGDMLYLKDPNYTYGFISIAIDFEAGYPSGDVDAGETPVAECPAIMKQCVRDTIAHLYSHRGEDTVAIPRKVRAMMTRFAKVGGWAG